LSKQTKCLNVFEKQALKFDLRTDTIMVGWMDAYCNWYSWQSWRCNSWMTHHICGNEYIRWPLPSSLWSGNQSSSFTWAMWENGQLIYLKDWWLISLTC